MRLAFSRFGEHNASNIVILHGLLGSKKEIGLVLENLFQILGSDVWLVDLRNHGDSEWNDKHTYFDLAEDVKNFLEEHGIVKGSCSDRAFNGRKVWYGFRQTLSRFLSKLVVVDIAPVTYPPNFENYLKVLLSLDLGSFKSRSEVDSKLSKYLKEISFRSFLMQNLKLDDKKLLLAC